MEDTELREQVRARDAEAALAAGTTSGRTPLEVVDSDECCSPAADAGPTFGSCLYSATEQGELPVAAVEASLGRGNPILVAELHEGEKVLDLGSGGGIDVLLSARRVGEHGFAYGLDMTDEMLDLARRNAAEAGVENAELVKGVIEDIPLGDQTGSGDLQLRDQPVHRQASRPTSSLRTD
ncbi:MAG: methyltransferase domain-containing protein [Nocardioides sp.]